MARVHNVHGRRFRASADRVGALLDSLATENDRLWPFEHWPAMQLDRPLSPGAAGGHGPIGYVVETYEPGRHVRFRFRAPAGFDGYHELYVSQADGTTRLDHLLAMTTRGAGRLSWPLIFRPLHDALVEDALDKAAVQLGETPRDRAWSKYVRGLRAILRRAGDTRRH